MTADPAPPPLFFPNSDDVTGPRVDGAPDEPVLDVDDIQGVVVPGFGTKFQHIILTRFSGLDPLRQWIATARLPSTLAEVMAVRNTRRSARRADPQAPPPEAPVMGAIGLTSAALRLLTDDVDTMSDDAFIGGMLPRSVNLDDPRRPDQPGHRSHWVFGGTADTVPHAVQILAADNDLELDDAVDAAKKLITDIADATLLFQQRGCVLAGEVEHFGFRDGVSQVGVRGRLSDKPRHFLTRRWLDPEDDRAKELARPGQPLVWPGRFIYGYPAGSITDALAAGEVTSGGPTWTHNGSMLVMRRLRQDVAAFRAFIAEESARLQALGRTDMTPKRLAASLVGRWPNGSSLIRSPHGPDDAEGTDMLSINGFGYANPQEPVSVCNDCFVAGEALAAAAGSELRTVTRSEDDHGGLVCPKFAHIRKVNPRDLQTDQENDALSTRTFQMLRRGITWGTPYAEGEPAAAADRGLIFMSYQTDIEEQFEQLNIKWMNAADKPERGGSGHDLLVGQNNEGDRAARLEPDKKKGLPAAELSVPQTRTWIIPTGGGYFLSRACRP